MRKEGFELWDKVRGNRLAVQLKEIEHFLKLGNYEALVEQQKGILKQLLDTATDQSLFYKKYKGYSQLSDFPVVDKRVIKDNIERFNIPAGKNKRKKVRTSGSTGTPFTIYQSQNKRQRNRADTLYFAKSAGYEVGHRLLYLRFWAAYYRKPKWLAFLQNITQLEVEAMTEAYLEEFIPKLCKDTTPKGWLGYPSGFDKIIAYLEDRKYSPLDCKTRSIIAMSEPLPEHTRQKMAYYFNCPVVSRYSNVENGILAQQMPGTYEFTINWASYRIEVLDMDEDKPARAGEVGRIVVTDLYNYATPMIRYDTGDVGILRKHEVGLPVFERIEGRKTDMLTNTSGEIVNPFVFYNSLGDFPELNQVQVVQNGHSYTFRINARNAVFKREREFIDYFVPFLGKGAEVQVDYVHETPKLRSGKRKMIVNLTDKEVNSES